MGRCVSTRRFAFADLSSELSGSVVGRHDLPVSAQGRFAPEIGGGGSSKGQSGGAQIATDQRARLFGNIAEATWGVPPEIVERQIGHFTKVHPDYSAGVRRAIGTLTRAMASQGPQAAK